MNAWSTFRQWLAAEGKYADIKVRHEPLTECPNCHQPLSTDDRYCPSCGQKIHGSRLTVFSLVQEFFGSLFNVDNSIYRSFVALPLPGYLSHKFIQGKRKKYLNPIRFFLIALIIHITVLTYLLPIDEMNQSIIDNAERAGVAMKMEEFQSLKDSLSQDFLVCDLDTIESMLFYNVNSSNDSTLIYHPDSSQTNNILPFILDGDRIYKYKNNDIYHYSIEQFLERYNLTNAGERLLARQFIRANREPATLVRFLISNLLWSVFGAIIVTAFFMKVVYARRNKFVVEHLIVLFNIHTFAFLITSLGLYLGDTYTAFTGWGQGGAYILSGLFFFISLKSYYQQGWIKTGLKFFGIILFYIVALVIMSLLFGLVSLFLF